MRTLVLIPTLFFSVVALAEISQNVGVIGFQEWKNTRITEAKQNLEKVKAEAPPRTAAAQRPPIDAASRTQKPTRGDQRLEQAELNLEIAQELSVNDYFVLYLNQFKDRSAFMEAAQKLSSQEAADLMMAYQKHLAADSAPEANLPGITVKR